MPEYKERLAAYQRYIEDYLKDNCLPREALPQKILIDAMGYSLLAGGKRLRPVMTMEFCRMCGGDWRAAAPVGAAVEMIHTYSLIHDDLPCMDNDDYRRGKLTNHKVYGEAMATLAGDALLTDAFGVLAGSGLPAEKMGLAVSILATNAGSLGMVGGQVLDMQSETRECSEQEILDIQMGKTVALINSACVLGVLAGGGSEDQIQAAAAFAVHLGLAFQIRDDMLDVIGDKEKLGKATGMDGNKNTFVRLWGLSKCSELVSFHTEKAVGALSAFSDRAFMTWLAGSLVEREF